MITAQDILHDTWAALTILFYFVYSWLEVVYRYFKPSYKSVRDEIVLITGAAGGIGSVLVRRFLELGSIVVCVDYNQKELSRLKDEVSSIGDKNNNKRVHFYALDITSQEQVKAVSERIRQEVGNVDILINNAGVVNQAKLLLELTDQEIIRLFQVNTLAHFWLVREFLPSMLAKNHGHIVNVASVCGIQGGYKLTDYCSSKFAVVGFTESLRIELNLMNPNNRINVTLVCPFHVKTKLFQGVEFRKFKWLPLSLTPEHVGECIVNGVLTNKNVVHIPSLLVHIYLAVKGMATINVSDYAFKCFDFHGGMDRFKRDD